MSVVRKRQWGEEEDAGGVEVAGGEPGEETAGGEDAVEDAKLDEGAWGEAPVTDAELSASPDEGVDVAGWGAGEQVDEATPLDAAAGDDAWGGEKEVDGDGAAPDAGGASAWGAEKVDSTTTAADDEVGDWGQKMEDTTDTSTSADETAGESTATTGTDEWGATIPSTELDEETSGTASEVEPLPSAFLSPFDEDDYDLPPTILPDGPTHQNPMLAKPNAVGPVCSSLFFALTDSPFFPFPPDHILPYPISGELHCPGRRWPGRQAPRRRRAIRGVRRIQDQFGHVRSRDPQAR